MSKLKLLFMVPALLITFTANADTNRVTKICRWVTAMEYEKSWAFGTLTQEFLDTENLQISRQKSEQLIHSIDRLRANHFEMIKLLEKDQKISEVALIIRDWAFEYGIDLGVNQPGKDKGFYERSIFNECKQRFFSIFQDATNDSIQSLNTKSIIDELINKKSNNPPAQTTIIIQQPPPNIITNPNACIQDGGLISCPKYPLR